MALRSRLRLRSPKHRCGFDSVLNAVLTLELFALSFWHVLSSLPPSTSFAKPRPLALNNTNTGPPAPPLPNWCSIAVAIPVASRQSMNMQSLIEHVLQSYGREANRRSSECQYSFAIYDVQLKRTATDRLNRTALHDAVGHSRNLELVRSGYDEVHRNSGIAKLSGEEKHKRDIRFVLTDMLERRIPAWNPSHVMLAEDDFEVCSFGLLEIESAIKLGNIRPQFRQPTLTLFSFGLNGMMFRTRDVHGVLVHVSDQRFVGRPIDHMVYA